MSQASPVIDTPRREPYLCSCISPTTQKIIVLIAGLMVLAAGLALYYINLNSISSINPIASYATLGLGSSFILGAVIWGVIDCIRGKTVSNLANTESELRTAADYKESFKLGALAAHHDQAERIAVDLTLTEKENIYLKEIIHDLDSQWKTDKAVIHGSDGIWVFSTSEIPGRIFKVRQRGTCCSKADFHKRVEDSKKAQQVIREKNLYLLHLPEQEIVLFDLEDSQVEILIEEQFDILHGPRRQGSLFQYCIADPDLVPFITEALQQLTILTLETGYQDLRPENNSLLSNGHGIGLVDFDTSDSKTGGLVTYHEETGIWGVCLSVGLVDSLCPILEKKLKPDSIRKLNLDTIKGHLTEDAKRDQEFSRYLTRQGVITGKEQVSLKDMVSFSSFAEEVQKIINERASENPGLCLTAERKFFIYKDFNQDVLDELKREGKIFDWMKQTDRRDSFNAFGFYVWC